MCEKDYILNPAACTCKNGKYLASIIDHPVIMCDEILDAETKTVTTSFNENNLTSKAQNFYILLAFLLITTALLIAFSIYSYLIKCWAKQKHFLPYYEISIAIMN